MLVIYNQMDLFKWLLALSFFTDAIDGYLARKFKVTSIAGTRLDSLGDDLTVAAGAIGMVVFKWDFLMQEKVTLILLFLFFVLHTILAIGKYGKLTGFHTYTAKSAAILQGIFLILLFFLPAPLFGLFYAAVIVTAIGLIEEIIIIFYLPKWEADVKGLYWIIKNRKSRNIKKKIYKSF